MNDDSRRLPIEPLTRAGFAPYGEVIDTVGSAPQSINGGTAQKFADLARVEVEGDPSTALPALPPAATIGIYRALPRTLPMQLLEVERHPLGSQAFVPLVPTRFLVVVAGANEEPSAADLRVFLARGQQGVSLRAGVWHHALLALDFEADFLVVERACGEGNLDRLQTASWRIWVGE